MLAQNNQPQQQSTQDLRSHATDQKRDNEFKHKWCPKWATSPYHRTVKLGPNNTKRPRRLASQGSGIIRRNYARKEVGKLHAERKQDVLSGKGNTRFDSSTDDDDDDELSSQASESPQAEWEGEDGLPPSGQEVLGLALTKAVEQYDHKVLVKLVKDEYEVLDKVDEEGHGVKVAGSDFDDEFELV